MSAAIDVLEKIEKNQKFRVFLGKPYVSAARFRVPVYWQNDIRKRAAEERVGTASLRDFTRRNFDPVEGGNLE